MGEENDSEKTEDPTPRRLQQAREEGQIPKSSDLAGAVVVLVGMLMLYYFGGIMVQGMSDVIIFSLKEIGSSAQGFTQEDILVLFIRCLVIIGKTSWFFWLAIIAAALISNISMVGFYLSGKPLEPKFERLNFIKGIQQKFSLTTLNLLVQNLGKFSMVGVVVLWIFVDYWAISLNAANIGYRKIVELLFEGTMSMGIYGALALLIWSFLDLFYQKWQHNKKLRMSKDELKKELKDMEGDPFIKQRRRQIQLTMARQRMMSQVPDADVIVTNPTFLAIAIKYDEDEMAAPVVLAKGMRKMAEKIRDQGKDNDVPIVQRPDLAREIFEICDPGEPIPENLYSAVAEVLAFVYKIKNK